MNVDVNSTIRGGKLALSIKIDCFNIHSPEYRFNYRLQGNPTIGITLGAAEGGEKVTVSTRGFLTDYDGDFFFDCLNHAVAVYLNQWCIKHRKSVSEISNCFIFISKNNEIEVLINCPTFMEVIAKENIQKGSNVFKDDIANISKIFFNGVTFKNDKAFIYIFSKDWRRGVYYDFLPIQKEGYEIGDTGTLFAALHSYMMYPEIFRMDDIIKEKMYDSGWFPFIRILGNNYEELYNTLKNNFNLTPAAIKIIDSFDEKKINEIKARWMKKELFKSHANFLNTGIERYLCGDYISAIHVLYPHIEGLMRYIYLGETGKAAGSDKLREKLIEVAKTKYGENGLHLPDEFNEYLTKFYFGSFKLEKGEIDLSRHSLAHGVAKLEDFNRIGAFQAILILDQIYFYL